MKKFKNFSDSKHQDCQMLNLTTGRRKGYSTDLFMKLVQVASKSRKWVSYLHEPNRPDTK